MTKQPGLFDDKTRLEIMCRIFEWAYRNHIAIKLVRQHGLSATYPELHFSKGGKYIVVNLLPVTDLVAKINSEWKRIALDLVIEPLALND